MKLDLDGYEVLPGLINAHDHLEFNLFPALGEGSYRNATEWALDIYRPEASPVREHLRVPVRVRLWWGGLKNLLSGVTTVCHHNPYEASVFGPEFPVRVVRRFTWAHSLRFEVDLEERLRGRREGVPFVIHCAEGTDSQARCEVDSLDAMSGVDARTVLVHGVAIAPRRAEELGRRGVSLVWCPTSNLRMLGRTLSRAVLRSGMPIALGTDSGLSAPVDLIDEMAVARRYLPEARVWEMVTTVPQRILRLSATRDWIARGPAGEVAVVVNRGRLRLISPELARQLPWSRHRRLQPLAVEGRAPVLVDAPVGVLARAARKHLGPDLFLAGKRVLV